MNRSAVTQARPVIVGSAVMAARAATLLTRNVKTQELPGIRSALNRSGVFEHTYQLALPVPFGDKRDAHGRALQIAQRHVAQLRSSSPKLHRPCVVSSSCEFMDEMS